MFDKIKSAQARLRGHAHVTPVQTCRTLNDIVGAQVFLKCENFQRMGAFKFRGAFNLMSQLTEEQKQRGVVTHSSGNHGQAVALVGRLLDIETVVVMPRNSSLAKRAAASGYGARVVECEAAQREEVCQGLVSKLGYTLVPPFDHEEIVAGQGTATVEFFEQVKTLDVLLAPVGGGGLISGTAVAAKRLCPRCRVIGIEPDSGDDATRSFHSRSLQSVDGCLSIADGTRTPRLGNVNFPLILEHVDEMKTVTESEIMDAVRFLFYRTKLVVEPSGALGVAAILSGAVRVQGKVGILLSGGNVDAPTMTKILAA